MPGATSSISSPCPPDRNHDTWHSSDPTSECANIATENVRSDLQSQLRHGRYLRTPHQYDLLGLVNDKINAPYGGRWGDYWGKQKPINKYDGTASIIASSTYPRQRDFIYCGDHNSFRCNDRLFCPWCCWSRLGSILLNEFGDSFSADQDIHYIVLSLSRDCNQKHRLIFRDLQNNNLVGNKACDLAEACQPTNYGLHFEEKDDILLCRTIWDFFNQTIREFTCTGKGQIFSGAVGGPELSVRFTPLRALPHANFVCWSTNFTVEAAREIRRRLRIRMRDCRLLENIHIYPVVACYRISGSEHLQNVLEYISKPIDLVGAYNKASQDVEFQPIGMKALNDQTDTFLKNVILAFHNVRRIMRFGRCCKVSDRYLGQLHRWRGGNRQSRGRARRSQKTPNRRSKRRKYSEFLNTNFAKPKRARRHYYWDENRVRLRRQATRRQFKVRSRSGWPAMSASNSS